MRLPSINWIGVSVAFAVILTAAYVGLTYLDYVSICDRLQQPNDVFCSGDVVCIAEIKGEAYADLLVRLFFSPIIFVFVLFLVTFIFVMFTFLFETKPWRKWA